MNLRWLMLVMLWFSACTRSELTLCLDAQGERLCPIGNVCVPGGCATPEAATACATLLPGAACNLGTQAGVCIGGACLRTQCGDGVQVPSEACDDGNTTGGDGCAADCRSNETCGNGVVDAQLGEVCDDGNDLDADSCRRDCQAPRCGDGVTDTILGETCDAGSANSNESNAPCRPSCQRLRCGDGIIDLGEACDDGNTLAGDGCAADCGVIERCGNGRVELTEACDDGNADDTDGCRNNCTIPSCGDGLIDGQLGETCDAGMQNSAAPNAPCRPNCKPQRCGDGVVDDGETCDDGNTSHGDGCAADCASNETCGNGIIDAVVNETCDDGRAGLSQDGCSSTCAAERPVWQKLEQVPRARRGHGMTTLSVSNEVVRFGGETDQGLSNRLEVFDGQSWVGRASVVAPSPRMYSGLAYDAHLNEAVAFGGLTAAGNSNELWAWHTSGWRLRPTDVQPPARHGHALAYDDARQQLLMFGGVGDQFLGDTWRYAAGGWQRIETATAPSPRMFAVAAYDPGVGRLVLFGGRSSTGELGDTWEFDGATWLAIAPAVAPEPRAGHAMAYDPLRRAVVLVGGRRGSLLLDDVWQYQSGQWTRVGRLATPRTHGALAWSPTQQRLIYNDGEGSAGLNATTQEELPQGWVEAGAAVRPGGRYSHRAVYDSHRQRMVMYGGFHSVRGFLHETWEFDGRLWYEVKTAHHPPFAFRFGLAYDATLQRTVHFGGYDPINQTISGETWEYDGQDWQRNVTGDSTPRHSIVMVYDAARHVIVRFGGRDLNRDIYNETHEYRSGSWVLVPTVAQPSPRYGAQATYDPVRQRVILNGGSTGLTVFDDVWEFTGSNWMFVGRTAARYLGTLTYDEARQRLVLIQGLDQSINETAEVLELINTTWTTIATDAYPHRRNDHSAVYLPNQGAIFLFGGFSPQSYETASTADEYWYNGQWQRHYHQPVPAARQSHVFTYHAETGSYLLFGGTLDISNAFVEQPLADTWRWQDGSWAQIPTTTAPSARSNMAYAYDSHRKRTVIFGGQHHQDPVGETWEWTGARWEKRITQRTPTKRAAATMVYDAHRKVMVMVGGITPGTSSEIWEYTANNWLLRTFATKPSPRASPAMAFDRKRNKVVLHGGITSNYSLLDDTWEYDGTSWVRKQPSHTPPARNRGGMYYDPGRERAVYLLGFAQGGATIDATMWEYDGVDWRAVPPAPNGPEVPLSLFGWAYDAQRRGLVIHGGSVGIVQDTMWSLRYETPQAPQESCLDQTHDNDFDGRFGCADPDCWGRCTPFCPPFTSCTTEARCGDGICNRPLEDERICADDCQP